MNSEKQLDLDRDRSGSYKHTLTISEMARICRVSRQTLIYYDKNDILKPEYTDENGYRYYTIYQVPFLREICALKEKQFSLKDIANNLKDRRVDNVMELLEINYDDLNKQIEELQRKKDSIHERLQYYKKAQKEMAMVKTPYIKMIQKRNFLFSPWDTDKMTRGQLHLTHMKLRNQAFDMDVPVDYGWGAILLDESIRTGQPLAGAGGYVVLPDDFVNEGMISERQLKVADAGYYACMNVYAMPYDTSDLHILYDWIKENHYEIQGDLINECILDTTFYTENQKADYCCLQVPIKIPGLIVS